MTPNRQKKWPQTCFGYAALTLGKLRIPGEAGVGDTIARLVGPIGGTAYKKWRQSQGGDCGCEERQENLNRQFPY